jgi:hypothetical protein
MFSEPLGLFAIEIQTILIYEIETNVVVRDEKSHAAPPKMRLSPMYQQKCDDAWSRAALVTQRQVTQHVTGSPHKAPRSEWLPPCLAISAADTFVIGPACPSSFTSHPSIRHLLFSSLHLPIIKSVESSSTVLAICALFICNSYVGNHHCALPLSPIRY